MGKHKKDKKHKKKLKKHKKEYSSSSSGSEYEWIESGSKKKTSDALSDNETKEARNERDEWMNLPTLFSSTSNKDRQERCNKNKKEQAESKKYQPGKSTRELNPYWKDGGDGLPKFAKPKSDSDEEPLTYTSKGKSDWKERENDHSKFAKPKYDSDEETSRYTSRNRAKMASSWRKRKKDGDSSSHKDRSSQKEKRSSPDIGKNSMERSPRERSRDRNDSFADTGRKDEKESAESQKPEVLSEKELNLLAGKLVKAEIMGNTKLVEVLKTKLENARKAVNQAKNDGIYEEILLTHTDNQGRSQPVKFKSDFDETLGGKKQKRRKTETHNKNNERVRYFADDDNYSLKQMFEEEKYGNSNKQDKDFVELAGKVKKNDDLDDLFTDEVRRTKSDIKIDASNRDKAIHEHQKMVKALENCDKCIQSETSAKHLIVSMGDYIYLALPAREPLTEGHCYIVPIRHVTCATALDENEWAEIMDFCKALIRHFATKDEEPIFFECAMYFYKQPHMVIECIPVTREDNIAPIYFKKAIEESETEWAQNKKLVSLKGRDVRRAIPKGLPYFFASFGPEEGFAHVIEDEKLFPKYFAQEIIGGMLDLHHNKWRNPKRESFNEQSKRVLKFSNEWKTFDCTNRT